MMTSCLRTLRRAAPLLFASWVTAAPPDFVYLDYGAKTQTRQAYREGAAAVWDHVHAALREADAALTAPITSVMDKTGLAASGDRHDYFTIAPYFWPDPTKADGLPFIRHDGKVNPMARDQATDYLARAAFFTHFPLLVEGYFYTGNSHYRDRALLWLDTWFVDPATRMNPNLNYAQGVPGVSDGRCFGIIEWTGIGNLITAIQLLQAEDALPAALASGIQQWFREYAHWFQFSELAQEEGTRLNNHGTWYDVQLVGLLLFAGLPDQARTVLESVKSQRIATQIEPDGSQPHEIARTKSLSYSTMNLKGFVQLATFGARHGVDLWGYETTDGRSIPRALAFLEPYYTGREKWPHPQLGDLEDAERSLMAFATASQSQFGPLRSTRP